MRFARRAAELFGMAAGAVGRAAGAALGLRPWRVLIRAGDSGLQTRLMAVHGVRWDFGPLGFTNDLTPRRVALLALRRGVSVSLVPTARALAVPPLRHRPRRGSSTRATPAEPVPWGVKAVYGDPKLAAASGGAGVRVAVLDTGVYFRHPDLRDRIEQCKDFTARRGMRDGKCDDKNGHGTHVAGSAVADAASDGRGIYGVAPGARLWGYKVLGNGGVGFVDDIAAGIRHAADEGVRLGVKVVINLSLGSSSPSSLLREACTHAAGRGALVVAAAGNSGPAADTIVYPAAFPGVMAVGALENQKENGTLRVADFSSRGKFNGECPIHLQTGEVGAERCTEVAAPGRGVESTWKDGGYEILSGTSTATPHVAGLAARVWASNPSWSATELRAELQRRAVANDIKGGNHAGDGYDIASGFGFPLVQPGE